jgi:acetyl-CoA decarbonylase/synthase complex subunit gamma
MKLAAKQVELSACPYVSEASKTQLAESAAPPVRLVAIKSDGYEVKSGNEVVLYRHEKTFYNKPGLFVKVSDELPLDRLQDMIAKADHYMVNYVGIELTLDGFAVQADSKDSGRFAAAVRAVRAKSKRPIVLICPNAEFATAGLSVLAGESAMIHAANHENWEAMADVAKTYHAALSVAAGSLDELADLTEKIKSKGVEDLVVNPVASSMAQLLISSTQIRRLAIKKNFRALGYPIIAFPKNAAEAAQAISKYAGFIVLDHFTADLAYPLLVLRQNIYTDPQKPIQVQPGIYEINNPKPEDPVLVTTNFSITYFSVANEVEGSGLPAWLMVCDAEGMSVLTAWAAGKFDSERIAKSVKTFNIMDKVSRKRLVLPGHVAVLSGELEAELPDWEIRVGPREAVDLPKFMKQAL